jgi:hypothetical protein
MWSSVDEISCVLIWNDASMTLLIIDSSLKSSESTTLFLILRLVCVFIGL